MYDQFNQETSLEIQARHSAIPEQSFLVSLAGAAPTTVRIDCALPPHGVQTHLALQSVFNAHNRIVRLVSDSQQLACNLEGTGLISSGKYETKSQISIGFNKKTSSLKQARLWHSLKAGSFWHSFGLSKCSNQLAVKYRVSLDTQKISSLSEISYGSSKFCLSNKLKVSVRPDLSLYFRVLELRPISLGFRQIIGGAFFNRNNWIGAVRLNKEFSSPLVVEGSLGWKSRNSLLLKFANNYLGLRGSRKFGQKIQIQAEAGVSSVGTVRLGYQARFFV